MTIPVNIITVGKLTLTNDSISVDNFEFRFLSISTEELKMADKEMLRLSFNKAAIEWGISKLQMLLAHIENNTVALSGSITESNNVPGNQGLFPFQVADPGESLEKDTEESDEREEN